MYNLGTLLQLVIAALAIWMAKYMLSTENLNGDCQGLTCIGKSWFLCAVAVDQMYWTVARVFTFEEGAWAKFEFEHNWAVVLIKANVLLSLFVWFLAKRMWRLRNG